MEADRISTRNAVKKKKYYVYLLITEGKKYLMPYSPASSVSHRSASQSITLLI